MNENETEDQDEIEAVEPVAESGVTDEVDDDDDVEGHLFGAALKPGGLVGNTASSPDVKGIVSDLNAYTVYGGIGERLPGEVSRPTRDR